MKKVDFDTLLILFMFIDQKLCIGIGVVNVKV